MDTVVSWILDKAPVIGILIVVAVLTWIVSRYFRKLEESQKKIEKLFTAHPLWEDWMAEYPDTFDLMNMDKFFGEMKTILSCPIEVVDWEHTDLRGRQMTPAELPVVDEIMRLMYSV